MGNHPEWTMTIRRRAPTRAGGARVTWEPGEHGPEGFYLSLGFELTGELSGTQTVARRQL